MGTNAINNVISDLNLINVEVSKSSESNDGFQKSFEEASLYSELAKTASNDVDVVSELNTENSAKDEYLKETSYSSPNRNISKTENTEKKTEVKEESDSNVSNIKKVSEKEDSEALTENAAAAVSTLVNDLANVLNVSVEELENYLSVNEISVADLSNNEILQQIVVDFTNVSNPIDILSDSTAYDIYTEVQNIVSVFNQLVENEGFDINEMNLYPVENIPAENIETVETNAETVSVKPEISDEHKALNDLENSETEEISVIQNDSKDEKVKTSDTDNKSSNDQSLNGSTQTTSNTETSVLPESDANTVTYSDMDPQEIYNQIGEYIRNLSSENLQEIEMKLQPETLGTIQVKVTQSEGVVKAELTTTNESVKAMLEGQLIQLKEDFERSGLKVEDVEVKVSTNAFNESTDSESRDDANEAARQMNSPRRINLLGVDNLDELEEIEEEEKVVVEMMTANGNSLDYKA